MPCKLCVGLIFAFQQSSFPKQILKTHGDKSVVNWSISVTKSKKLLTFQLLFLNAENRGSNP